MLFLRVDTLLAETRFSIDMNRSKIARKRNNKENKPESRERLNVWGYDMYFIAFYGEDEATANLQVN